MNSASTARVSAVAASSEVAQTAVRQVWREVGLLERDHRLDKGRDPDIGFAEAVHAWTVGEPLADVLFASELTAGDFVRWTRQVIDLAGQLADAAGHGPLRDTCREAIARMRRGVVAAAYEEDD